MDFIPIDWPIQTLSFDQTIKACDDFEAHKWSTHSNYSLGCASCGCAVSWHTLRCIRSERLSFFPLQPFFASFRAFTSQCAEFGQKRWLWSNSWPDDCGALDPIPNSSFRRRHSEFLLAKVPRGDARPSPLYFAAMTSHCASRSLSWPCPVYFL